MKKSSTQPSTDPKAAMNAYSGIRVGCWMDNSIRRRSLMIGNVSTEESRKEMRKRPGAPRPLAKATTLCFHPLRLAGKGNSSEQSVAACLGVAWGYGKEGCARTIIAQRRRGRNG